MVVIIFPHKCHFKSDTVDNKNDKLALKSKQKWLLKNALFFHKIKINQCTILDI